MPVRLDELLTDVVDTLAHDFDLEVALTALCAGARELLAIDGVAVSVHEGDVAVRLATAGTVSPETTVRRVPIRDGERVTGTLELFGAPSPAGDDATADAATLESLTAAAGAYLAVADERTRTSQLVDQLRSALASRIVIEQAKGVIAERWRLGMGPAFDLLRTHARATNQRLHELSQRVVDGEVDPLARHDRGTT